MENARLDWLEAVVEDASATTERFSSLLRTDVNAHGTVKDGAAVGPVLSTRVTFQLVVQAGSPAVVIVPSAAPETIGA